MWYKSLLVVSSFLFAVVQAQELPSTCTGTLASMGTILSGDPPTLRNIIQFTTEAHTTTCLQLQMPDGTNRRNITISIGRVEVSARTDVSRIVAPNSVPTLFCDDGCGDGYVPSRLYNWRDNECLNKPGFSYAQAAPRIVDHNDCNHNFFTGPGSPNYGYTGICLGGQELINGIVGIADPVVRFTVDGPGFTCHGGLTNSLVPCGDNSTIKITSQVSALASNIVNRYVSFTRKCILPTYLNPGRGCSEPSSQMWFSVLNADEASQCLLTRLNQAYWAGDPHCLNVGYDGASRTAVWDWHDCTPDGGDPVGLSSVTFDPDQKNVIIDDKNAVVNVWLDLLSEIAKVDYRISKCTLISASGNVGQASAAVSVIVRVQESSINQCGCRTADDQVINLACVSGYCVSDVPLSNYTTTTLCSLNCVTLNLTILEWNTTHTQYGEVVSQVHDAPPGSDGGLGGFFDSIKGSIIGMLFEFGRIWEIGSCSMNISCMLKSIFGGILSLLVYGAAAGVIFKLYKYCRSRSSSNTKVKVLVASAEKQEKQNYQKNPVTEMAELP